MYMYDMCAYIYIYICYKHLYMNASCIMCYNWLFRKGRLVHTLCTPSVWNTILSAHGQLAWCAQGLWAPWCAQGSAQVWVQGYSLCTPCAQHIYSQVMLGTRVFTRVCKLGAHKGAAPGAHKGTHRTWCSKECTEYFSA